MTNMAYQLLLALMQLYIIIAVHGSTTRSTQASTASPSTQPTDIRVDSFAMDLQRNILELVTNVPIPTGSRVVPSLVTVSGSTGDSVTFSRSAVLITEKDSVQHILVLATEDLTALNLNPNVANSAESTFISLQRGWLDGVLGEEVSNLQASTFIADTTSPVLFAAELAPSLFFRRPLTLNLFFSEVMDSVNFDVSSVALQTDGRSVPVLLEGPVSTSSGDSRTLILTLAQETTDRLISQSPFENLSVAVGFSTQNVDVAGNLLTTPVQITVSHSDLDFIAPQISGLEIDLPMMRVKILCTEPMDQDTVQLALASLSVGSQELSLGTLPDTQVQAFGDDLVLVLSKQGANLVAQLADSLEQINFEAESGFATDSFGNQLLAQVLPVTSVVRDINTLQLVSYTLNLNSEVLALQFSRPVAQVDLSSFTIANTRVLCERISNFTQSCESRSLVPLTGGSLLSNSGADVTFQVLVEDVHALKLSTAARSVISTFLLYEEGAVVDSLGIALEARSVSASLQVAEYTTDTRPPSIVDAQLLAASRPFQLILEFDDVMDEAPIPANAISLQVQGSNIMLDQSELLRIDGQPTRYIVELSQSDADSLLAAGSGPTSVTLQAGALTDSAKNPLPMSISQLSQVVIDTNRPGLFGFSLDLTQATLSLTFDQDVDSASVNIQKILLQGQAQGGASWRLGSPSTFMGQDDRPLVSTASTGNTVVLNIPASDFAEIVSNSDVARVRRETFLSLDEGAVLDPAGNPSRAVQGVPTTTFRRDRASPRLVGFDLDLTDQLLVLAFNEPIDPISLDLTDFTLQSSRIGTDQSIPLPREASVTSITAKSSVFGVALPRSFFSRLSREVFPTGSSEETSFLSVAAGAADDLSGNQLDAIAAGDAMRVSTFQRSLTVEPGDGDFTSTDILILLGIAAATLFLIGLLLAFRFCDCGQHKDLEDVPFVPPRTSVPNAKKQDSEDLVDILSALERSHGHTVTASSEENLDIFPIVEAASRDNVSEVDRFPRRAETKSGYEAVQASELSFAAGATLNLLEPSARPGWIVARNSAGHVGIVADYMLKATSSESESADSLDIVVQEVFGPRKPANEIYV